MEVVSFDSERWRRRGAAPAARHPSRALVRSRRHLDGHVRDVEAAIALLRHQGVAHVVLVGASFGGATVMTYGSRVPADGGVSLSGEASLPTRRLDALAGVRRLRVPLLIVGSRRDGYLPVSDALRLLRAAGSRDKRTRSIRAAGTAGRSCRTLRMRLGRGRSCSSGSARASADHARSL